MDQRIGCEPVDSGLNSSANWVNKEDASSMYVVAVNEEPVIPEYDYTEVRF